MPKKPNTQLSPEQQQQQQQRPSTAQSHTNSPRTSPNETASDFALHDYHMQLQLLDQQNQKHLEKARKREQRQRGQEREQALRCKDVLGTRVSRIWELAIDGWWVVMPTSLLGKTYSVWPVITGTRLLAFVLLHITISKHIIKIHLLYCQNRVVVSTTLSSTITTRLTTPTSTSESHSHSLLVKFRSSLFNTVPPWV